MRVAVIPARGGSKRIPRKNVRDFAGKPMIAHSIECALRSNLFDRVIVSTDDQEVAGIARTFGAETPFVRPADLAGDSLGTTPVIAHAVDWLEREGSSLSAVCCIYATAPFIQLNDLLQGAEVFSTGKWNYVFSATAFSYPIFRAFRKNNDGGVEMFYPEQFPVRSQDLPVALHDAGQFYWGRPTAWKTQTTTFGPESTVVLIPPWRAQDIDTPADWIRAEHIMSLLAHE